MKRTYYYEFVVGDHYDREQTIKRFAEEGLDENGISDLENDVLKENQELAYCKYIGEGWL